MPDPQPDAFDALRAPIRPVDPDRAFAAHLRARLERALALPTGVVVSQPVVSQPPVSQPAGAPMTGAEPAYRHGDIGYAWLSVPDLDRAVAFHASVLGWSVTAGSVTEGRQVVGRSPHLGLHGADPRSTLNCCYAVEDVATAVDRVRAAGGRAGEPSPAPYGLISDCTDDQGTVFALYQPPGGVGTEPTATGGEGDLVYTTFEVVDSARARAFYGEVLGWSFVQGGVADGWQVDGRNAGLQGGHSQATTLPMWQVADLASAVERVRAAGGTATEARTRPYGLESECTDDQGTRFYLGQL